MLSTGCAMKHGESEAGSQQADLTVESIEQLRSVSASQDMKVYVAGFATAADGGEGLFKFVANSQLAITPDDVGYLVKSADGNGWWQRDVSTKKVSVKWFGATGDGAHDDASAVATATEVANRLGSSLYVPAGTYRVDGIGKRVALSNISISSDSQELAKLVERVPATGNTVNYYPTSVS